MKNVADIYPLTPTQAGILYHTLRAPQEDLYFQQISCTLRGTLNVDKFKQAWDEVVARHPALRSIFLWEGVEEPLQVVRETVTLPWIILDWRGSSSEQSDDRLSALSRDYRAAGFDLTKAPILRMALIQLEDETFHFIWNFHHLLTDGWSTHLVFHEAFAVYDALVRGESFSPAPVRPFRDYIDWLKAQDDDAAEKYWRRQLGEFPAPTPFQVDTPALQGALIKHAETSLVLDAVTSTALKNVARQNRLTLNTIVQGAWSILLSRYSAEEGVVFGTTLSGRPAELRGAETMVGMFINTLPLCVKVTEDSELIPWLQGLQTQQLEMRQYEYSALAKIQRWSDVEPGQPLFESIVVFENYPTNEAGERSLRIKDMHYREQSNYPLALLVLPGDEMRLLVIYDQARFEEDAARGVLRHLNTLLVSIGQDPAQKIADLSLLDASEYQQVVVDWNDTKRPLGELVWVHEQIATIARRAPEQKAVVASDGALTYGELDGRANQLAHHLIRRGAKPGTPIALYMDRSAKMMVGILGILKAGCAYVPLDPTYPAARISYVLNDMQAPMVVTQPHLVSQLGLPEERTVVLDDAGSQTASEPLTVPDISISSQSLAYLIYTSGSTGMPKGVMVTHQNLFYSNTARGVYYKEKVNGYLLLSSFAFDSSVAGIFWTLTDGGTLVLPAPGDERDIEKLSSLIAREKVSHTLALPSLYRLLLDYAPTGSLNTLRAVIVAGESCPPELGAYHYSKLPAAILYNEYGPTEASVWSSVYLIAPNDKHKIVPIGKPIANYQLYVLDRRGRPVPVGVPGELMVGGLGIVPGYWQRPELTKERFAPNPFGEGNVYHTGDRVRWLADGNLEFLGRVDHQVKVRGFRIELGEIETALRQHRGVSEALVTMQSGRLIAYLIAEEKNSATQQQTDTIRNDLARRLPEYMVPSAILWLDDFPRTPNGKIDRKNLPEPESIPSHSEVGYVAPQTETEEKIHALWSEILGLTNISVRDDFFRLGGHSLLIIQLVSSLRQAFELPIPLSAVMDTRTIAGQAERIDTLTWSKSGLAADQKGYHSPGKREEFEI